jgi:hypothetical protein
MFPFDWKKLRSKKTMATRAVSAIDAAVQRIKQVNINFLAIDFDQTFIDIHTGGVWTQTQDELIPHVRQEFIDLCRAALQTGHIHVAIVTFSQQPALIKGVLEAVLGTELASKIPVRGGDRSWRYEGLGTKDGKQAHMASAVEELEQSGEIEITKSTTLLIDDDERNIRIAMDDGVRAVWFCPNKPHHLLRDLAKLI